MLAVTESSDDEPLRGAAGVKLSPDDRFVFVAVRKESRIAVYERNADGTLALFGYATGPEVAFVNDLVLSADGSRLYAASSHAGTLSVWAVRPCHR
ncbi:MAG: beta-propeller fold lactonase family protein [Myxococcales bacterium]|nr:beta-propeller fold lactonase family protein [Myxococcales bacterium]